MAEIRNVWRGLGVAFNIQQQKPSLPSSYYERDRFLVVTGKRGTANKLGGEHCPWPKQKRAGTRFSKTVVGTQDDILKRADCDTLTDMSYIPPCPRYA